MSSKIIESIEDLENRIENIKWLITTSSPLNKFRTSKTICIIRKSAGILNKRFPKGTIYENKIRKRWEDNFLKKLST